ncbi:MAG: hypothetical protein F9K29_12770 [Hyphomicrobiaceae bacterium]|nr:MAG: hypothetical protein F9K29_12770 [Hyphomicrobiaceae bacterium]
MTAPNGFVAQMRTQAGLGVLWWAAKWGALALLGVVWGIYLLVTPDRSAQGNKLWGVGILIAGLAGLAYVVRSAQHKRTPAGHPLDLELAPFGDPVAATRDIDDDFASKPFAARTVHVGRRWVCYAGKGQVTVRRLDTLVWAYTVRLTHKLNGIIPYRVSNYLMLWGRDETAAAIAGRKSGLDKSLAELRASAPWLPLGYSEVLKESWNADRREFIAEVDALRRDAQGTSSAPR